MHWKMHACMWCCRLIVVVISRRIFALMAQWCIYFHLEFCYFCLFSSKQKRNIEPNSFNTLSPIFFSLLFVRSISIQAFTDCIYILTSYMTFECCVHKTNEYNYEINPLMSNRSWENALIRCTHKMHNQQMNQMTNAVPNRNKSIRNSFVIVSIK